MATWLARHWGTALLALLLLAVQYGLWFGQGNWRERMRLESELAARQVAIADAASRNARVAAEVADLQEGLEMVEEKARSELGMVRANEVLVQITPRGR